MANVNKIEKWLINDKIKQDTIDLISSLEANADHPIRVVIHDKKVTRSEKQNKYLFGWVYGCAISQLTASGIEMSTGIPWTKDAFHAAMADSFLIKGEVKLPGGRIVTTRWSTTELAKKSRNDEEGDVPTFPWYVDQVKNFCFDVWQIQIPDPISPSWSALHDEVML